MAVSQRCGERAHTRHAHGGSDEAHDDRRRTPASLAGRSERRSKDGARQHRLQALQKLRRHEQVQEAGAARHGARDARGRDRWTERHVQGAGQG